MTPRLFVVERYLPGIGPDELRASAERLAAAAADLATGGKHIRYLGSTFVPEEGSCVCRFEASSQGLVDRACRQADFPYGHAGPGGRPGTSSHTPDPRDLVRI
jgi:Protein of unknown function (DUF4242)